MDPLTGTISWGIAGPGRIASSFATDFAHLAHGDDPEDARIAAVASRSQDRADAFAAEHGIGRAHGSHADLAADPSIDAVYVATLHPAHADVAVRYLEAGKHVLVEKPLAVNTHEVDRMVAAARANDRFLMEAMWMRFNPTHVEAVRRIHDGAIGEPRRVIADFSLAIPYDADHRLWSLDAAGGGLIDLGIYPLTLAWWTLGPPDVIHHVGHVAHGVDDEISLLCGWNSGASALLTTGLRLPGTMAARIEGTEGAMEFAAPGHAASVATLRCGLETEEIHGGPVGLHHQVAEVHRCLRSGEGESPRMTLATSRAVIAAFDAIRADLGVVYTGDAAAD